MRAERVQAGRLTRRSSVTIAARRRRPKIRAMRSAIARPTATVATQKATQQAPPQPAAGAECVCSFGATRAGALIRRVRLHLTTDRFLAAHRGDRMWESACDYAALALERLASQMKRVERAEWICATVGPGRQRAASSGVVQAGCVRAGRRSTRGGCR